MNPSPFYPRTLETWNVEFVHPLTPALTRQISRTSHFFKRSNEISCIFEISLKEKTRILTKSNDLNGENLDRAT